MVAADRLREELENLGAVKLRDVESAQRTMLAVTRRLESTGEIRLRDESEEVLDRR